MWSIKVYLILLEALVVVVVVIFVADVVIIVNVFFYIPLWSINVHLKLLKAASEFVWGGGVGGWGGLQSHFHVKPNFCYVWLGLR